MAPISSDTLEALKKRALPRIEERCRWLCRVPPFERDDREDLCQDMWRIILSKLYLFNGERCSMDGFLKVVIDCAACSMARTRLTNREKWHRSVRSLDDRMPLEDDESIAFHETLIHDRSERQRLAQEEIDAAMDGAPDQLWEVFHALEEGSHRKAAKRAKIDRKKLPHIMAALRQRFDNHDAAPLQHFAATSDGHRVVNE